MLRQPAAPNGHDRLRVCGPRARAVHDLCWLYQGAADRQVRAAAVRANRACIVASGGNRMSANPRTPLSETTEPPAPIVTVFANKYADRITAARPMDFAELERVIRS